MALRCPAAIRYVRLEHVSGSERFMPDMIKCDWGSFGPGAVAWMLARMWNRPVVVLYFEKRYDSWPPVLGEFALAKYLPDPPPNQRQPVVVRFHYVSMTARAVEEGPL